MGGYPINNWLTGSMCPAVTDMKFIRIRKDVFEWLQIAYHCCII